MKKLESTAIICEYNPFHNGHAYQMKRAKEFSQIIICIMSGNTVQRGGFSCSDKYERAKIAINNGADLVVEHPFPYCMSSAADFSSSGVYIANSMKADYLAFGHESDENLLLEIAEELSKTDFEEWIASIYKSDKEIKKLSFPRLREQYLRNILGKEKAEAMKLPNNILSVEYLLNLKKYPNINPKFIKRNFDFISAGNIREKIKNSENISNYVPENPKCNFNSFKSDAGVLTFLKLSDEYKEYYDCDESLYNRIISFAKESNNLDDLIYNCTTSAYTSSKVRRTIFSIFFSIKRKQVKTLPAFTVLLGATSNGLKYISENKKDFIIPVLSRASDEKLLNLDTTFNFKADKMYSFFSNEKYSPYKKPYISTP